jgi:hypothetical protein
MRDPNRIYPIMGIVTDLWTMIPDMRFGQLLGYIKDLVPVNDGSRLTNTMHLLIEDHVYKQFLESAVAKIKEEDYNRQKLEREYINESSKRPHSSSH